MSDYEFGNYVKLIGKLLKLTPDQRDQISGELRDHLEMRVDDLMSKGATKQAAFSQALDEFGDAAAMANNFQSVINYKKRRRAMYYATFSIAGTFLAAVLAMALWPTDTELGAPTSSWAQESVEPDEIAKVENTIGLSDSTQRNLHAESIIKNLITTLQYDETPFSEVKEELERILGLNIVLHQTAMDDSLTSDEPITINLRDVPMDIGLEMLLEPENATYTIDSGVIVIISKDVAEDAKFMRVRMFDCQELVQALPKPPVWTWNVRPNGGFGGGGRTGGGGFFRIPQMGGIVQQPETTQLSDNKKKTESRATLTTEEIALVHDELRKFYASQTQQGTAEDTLIDLVQSLVDSDSWIESGQGEASVKIVNGILIVKQQQSAFRKIENLLDDLKSSVVAGQR